MHHDPFPNWLTASGVEALAAIIRGYWAQRGFAIETRVVAASTKPGTIYCVRSDLLNGLPRGYPIDASIERTGGNVLSR